MCSFSCSARTLRSLSVLLVFTATSALGAAPKDPVPWATSTTPVQLRISVQPQSSLLEMRVRRPHSCWSEFPIFACPYKFLFSGVLRSSRTFQGNQQVCNITGLDTFGVPGFDKPHRRRSFKNLESTLRLGTDSKLVISQSPRRLLDKLFEKLHHSLSNSEAACFTPGRIRDVLAPLQIKMRRFLEICR